MELSTFIPPQKNRLLAKEVAGERCAMPKKKSTKAINKEIASMVAGLLDSYYALPRDTQPSNAEHIQPIANELSTIQGLKLRTQQKEEMVKEALEEAYWKAEKDKKASGARDIIGQVLVRLGLPIPTVRPAELEMVLVSELGPLAPPEMKHNLIKNVTLEEWEAAKEYFNANPEKTKLDRKNKAGINVVHSFIKLKSGDQDIVYVMANKANRHLGEGGFGKVKFAQNEQGEVYVVKAQGAGIAEWEKELSRLEQEITQDIGYLKAHGARDYGKVFKEKYYAEKEYLVTDLVHGENLLDELYHKPMGVEYEMRDHYKNNKNIDKKLIIAARACQAIEELHQKNILHRDIKPANFMYDENNEGQIRVTAIDFGLSIKLNAGESQIETGETVGTPPYTAPETGQYYDEKTGKLVLNPNTVGQYSRASDVYALGIMMKYNLELDKRFYEDMIHFDPQKRISLPEAINRLNQALKDREYLNVLDFDLAQEYRDGREAKLSSPGIGSMFQKIKTQTRGIRGVNNERNNQIDEIHIIIEHLKSSQDLVREKAMVVYAKLDQVRNAVSSKSELGKLCEQHQQDIAGKFPGIKKEFIQKREEYNYKANWIVEREKFNQKKVEEPGKSGKNKM